MKEKGANLKIFLTIIFMIFFIILVTNGTKIMQKSIDVFVVANGSLYYEEQAEGIIIRDEVVLQGENYKNGMIQVIPDGERTAISKVIFRYYSNSEEAIANKMSELDEEINEIIEESGITIMYPSSDIISIEKQIENILDSMYGLNYLQKIQENKNKIDAYISKKAQITGMLSPSDSYIKKLTNERNALEQELENGSEIIKSPVAGIVSYRVDGLEDILGINEEKNFDYLNSELLDSFGLKVGAIVPLSNEKGKVVNNFKCYIATQINTEKSMSAKVGDKVALRLSTSDEIDAKIVYIKDEPEERIIVFEIEEKIADLLEYRKISFDIIWWKYTGWKISNSCLIEEDDKTYVEKNTAGYTDRILVKVLRQNDTFSIVENYDEDELKELGYSEEKIRSMSKIKLYDEILSH